MTLLHLVYQSTTTFRALLCPLWQAHGLAVTTTSLSPGQAPLYCDLTLLLILLLPFLLKIFHFSLRTFLQCLFCLQVVGPPGTGKTDVAVQIISNIYHNFPEQRTLIVTHSNQVTAKYTHKVTNQQIESDNLSLCHGGSPNI